MRNKILLAVAFLALAFTAASAKSAFDGGPPEPCPPGTVCNP
jgi:hypothetical protein